MWHTRRRVVGGFLVWALLVSSSSWATEVPEKEDAAATSSEQSLVWLPSSLQGWASFAAVGAGATAGVLLPVMAISALVNDDLPVAQPLRPVLLGALVLSTVAAPLVWAPLAGGLVGGVKGMIGALAGPRVLVKAR